MLEALQQNIDSFISCMEEVSLQSSGMETKPTMLCSHQTTLLNIYVDTDATWNNPCKEVVAHPTGVLSEVKWWSRCGPRLRREWARACLLGPDGAGPDAACSSLPRGSCWASGSAGRGPGGGNGRCPSLCRWCHPSSWSAGLAPWACSCPPPCADLGREKAFQLSQETNIIS